MSYMGLASLARAPASLASIGCPFSFGVTETALLLFIAAPAKARAFALAQHERAAWQQDADLIEHWARVGAELGRLMRAQSRAG
ncbi:MAG: hypothetical protein AB7F35_28190 [Acetobacteraceae bacterium]